jgi:small-conductance mechanosensitive channel
MNEAAAAGTGADDQTLELNYQLIELRHLVRQSVHWLGTHAAQIAIALVVGIALYLLMNLVKRSLCRLREKAGDDIGLATLLARTFSRTTHFFMAMAAARLVTGYASPPEPVAMTIRFLFTVAAVFQGAIWAREFLLGMIERRTLEDGRGETLANAMGLIRVLVTFALFAIAAIMVLDNLGVNVTGLVAGLGIGGIAIGLAAQGIFSDLFSALSIIFDKPFRQGETIQFGTTTATVERIGLKSTRLRSIDGEQKIISNAKLLEQEITNFNDISVRRYIMPIGVIFQTPPDKADRIPDMLRRATEDAGAEFQRAGFSGFGASSIDYEFSFFIHGRDIDDVLRVRHHVGMNILRVFSAEGVEFAYPTQTTFTAAPDGTMIWPYPRPKE